MRDYPLPLRRIRYHDVQASKTFNFLTNNFAIPAQTVADLYRYRRQVELFFMWIKQRLRIKSFFGNSENVVKSQIGSLSRFTSSSLSSRIALTAIRISTQFYRF